MRLPIGEEGMVVRDGKSPYKKPKEGCVLDMRSLLQGDVNRLRYIRRHSTSLVIHKENVAEHSFYVALYSEFICRWVWENCENVLLDRLSILRRCLFHDLDESRTGDFQRPFKHRTPELKLAIEQAAESEFKEAIQPLFPESTVYLTNVTDLWINAKDETNEGRVVSFADYLSVVSYLMGEVGAANFSVMHHYQTLLSYGSTFDHESYDFIRPLVIETEILVNKMMVQAGVKTE